MMRVWGRHIALRRDTADRWAKVNPVLFAGEPGIDLTHDQLRIGDGRTSWTGLPVATPEDALRFLLDSR